MNSDINNFLNFSKNVASIFFLHNIWKCFRLVSYGSNKILKLMLSYLSDRIMKDTMVYFLDKLQSVFINHIINEEMKYLLADTSTYTLLTKNVLKGWQLNIRKIFKNLDDNIFLTTKHHNDQLTLTDNLCKMLWSP